MTADGRASKLNPALVLLAGGLALASALVGTLAGGRAAATLLVLLQATGLALWFRQGWGLGRGWPTANFVAGAAWVVLFLVPSAVYTADPGLLSGLDVSGAIAVVDISLFALLAGYAALATGASEGTTARLKVRARQEHPRMAAVWFAVGLVGLAVLMIHAGGPTEYLSRLNETAGLNAGLFYVVWIALALRFSPFALIFLRWARGASAGAAPVLLCAAGLGLLLMTGARSFVAVGGAQLVLASALLRRRPSLSLIVPLGILATLVVVFGLGTVKRHQTYNAQHPQRELSLVDYARDVAPRELPDAYVNNYVDTVRLVAMARTLVPASAPYEGLRPLIQVALKPIPSGIRPAIPRNRNISRVFEPRGSTAYAQPLQASTYLSGGPVLVALTFGLVGFGIAALDLWLTSPRTRSPAPAAAAIALCVQIPMMLRAGVPNGLAFLAIEVIGTAVVTWSIAGGVVRLRRSRAGVIRREPESVGAPSD